MRIRCAFQLFVLCLLAASPAVADIAIPRNGATAPVVAVIDGDTLVLDGGREVRLVGIQAPKLPLGRAGFRPWPLAAAARRGLADLALNKTLTLRYGGRRVDRHDRLLAHLFDPGGRWIQGALIAAGLARVYSFADNRGRIAEMLALETKARRERRGIWAHPYYRVLTVTETPKFIDSFQLVEGRVRSAAVVRGRGYLNFGDDWRTDFTVAIPPRQRRLFLRAGIEIAAYAGRRIRVRGWLKSFNGPMIEATHPEQIEVLEE